MWYVGQKVVCVNGIEWGGTVACVTGQVYTVKAISACCVPLLDIGAISNTGGTACRRCYAETHGSIWWLYADRFRPLDPLEEQLERIEMEGAPLELEPEYA